VPRRHAVLLVLTMLAIAVPASPAVAQDDAPANTPDVPTDLFDPVAPESQQPSDSGGLPLIAVVGGLIVVAVAGFALGEMMPSRRARRDGQDSWIALWRSGTTAEFRVVVGHGPRRHVIGRSERFPAPAHGAVPDDGAARAAYEDLIERLRALGWEPAGRAGDNWYSLDLVQRAGDQQLTLA
jgi:hypothetical protein